jgi:hypothetical protein
MLFVTKGNQEWSPQRLAPRSRHPAGAEAPSTPPGGRSRFRKRADLLDRADADAVGFAFEGLRHAPELDPLIGGFDPLFPGYVFVQLADEDRIRVLQIRLVRFVSLGGHPASVDNAEIELGSDKSRGYRLEMISADFLAGVNLDNGNPGILLRSMTGLFKCLTGEQKHAFLEQIHV